MSDRIDNELRRVTTALAEVSPPKPELGVPETSPRRRRSPLLVAVASFALVLGVGLVASLITGGDRERQPGVTATTISTVPAFPVGPVPETHLAAELLASGAGFDEFGPVSSPCARGGSAAGSFTLCLVDDAGLLVLVPLRMAANMEAAVRGSAFDREITIELPAVSSEESPPAIADLVAISHREGSVEVELMFAGESAGADVGGYLESAIEQSPSGIVPIPDHHVVWQVLAEEPAHPEIPELAGSMGVEFLCAAHRSVAQACVIWEDEVAVVVPFRIADGWSVQVSSWAIDGRLDIPVEEGVPVGVRHDSGRFTLLFIEEDGAVAGSSSTYFPSSSAP